MSEKLLSRNRMAKHLKITKKELNLVIVEMGKKLKDLAYINSEAVIEASLSNGIQEYNYMDSNDTLCLTYNITYSIGDILQIVGRERREADEEI